jgi:ABC-type glycerol-3-phosphate transport system permease component
MAIVEHTPGIQQPVVARHARYRRRGPRFQTSRMLLIYTILILFAIMTLLPFIWLITSSVKDTSQYFADPIIWLPIPAHWSNYMTVMVDYTFGRKVLNSLFLATFSAIFETTTSALVAYGFARFHFPGRNALFVLVLATMMVPSQLLTISLYNVFRNLGWLDTFLPLMVPKLFGSAFLIFILRQFFMGISKEPDEAARIDGCSRLGIFWRVLLPQARPALIVAMIFSFLASWTDAWGPLIYLSSEDNRTIPIGLLYFTTPYGPNYPLITAAAVVALAVPVILYAVGQRSIDRGIAIAEIR